MKKDFDDWNKNKKVINDDNENKLYHTRELWWCSLGLNVGSEQDGTGKDIDTKRFINKVGVLDLEAFKKITKAVKEFL